MSDDDYKPNGPYDGMMAPKETFLNFHVENAQERPTDAEAQYLDRPVLVKGADGTEHITRRIEKLVEGQVVDGPGGQYVVRRNELGYLYLSSITKQVGYKENMTVEEFTKTMLESLDFSALERAAEFAKRMEDASKVSKTEFARRQARASAISEIQPLFNDLFTDKAKRALSKKLNTVFDQRDEPTEKLGEYVRVIWPVQYAVVNITDQSRRYEAIKALAAAINDLAERDELGGCFAPLSSMVNGYVDTKAGAGMFSLWGLVKADSIEYSEIIFLYAAVKPQLGNGPDITKGNPTLEMLQTRYPGIFTTEWELPAPWGSK